MLHHKLIAGEIPGTYLVTELINEEHYKQYCRPGNEKCLSLFFSITSTGFWLTKSYFWAH